MNRYVIYSSLTGSYDEIRQPQVIDERFDYVLFTDSVITDRLGIWQVRPIPYSGENKWLQSRYVKCNPTKVLGEYDASLYIDANLQIATTFVYDRFMAMIDGGLEWAGIKHPSQDCIYEEICAIVDLHWVHDYEVVDWYGVMKKDGFPEKWGLYENNVIFRRHIPKIQAIGDLWWQTLGRACKRDQFSLMYALWKEFPKMDYFLSENECPRLNSSNFIYYQHKPHNRVLQRGINERIRNRCLRIISSDIRKEYHRLFDGLSRYRYPVIMLYCWEILAIFVYGPKYLYKMIWRREH